MKRKTNQLAQGTGRHRRMAGMTLVEIMVGLAIGLILLAGVIQAFVATRASYQTNQALSRVQENGRYTLDILGRDLRMAGYSGCRHLGDSEPNVIANGSVADSIDFSVDGYLDGNATGLGERSGTDTLTLLSASPEAAELTSTWTSGASDIKVNDNPDGWAEDALLLVTDCSRSAIVRVADVSGSDPVTISLGDDGENNLNNIAHTYDEGALVTSLRRHSYYVADTGRTNEGGDAIYALYRQDLGGTDRELVEGVENLQVQYGIDTSGDGDADSYADWSGSLDVAEVVSVRVGLLASSNQAAAQGGDAPDVDVLDTTVTPPADGRLRKAFTGTVSIRNRALLSESFK